MRPPVTTKRSRLVAATAFACLLSVLVAVPAQASVAKKRLRDFGDAPDMARADTDPTDEADEGHFPSLLSSNGARHSRAGGLRLGLEVDRERNSIQVDADGQDDGLRSALVPCRRTSLFFTLNAQHLPRNLRTSKHTAYLNAWFDWNVDGDWQDVNRCGPGKSGRVPEWRLQNHGINMSFFRKQAVRRVEVRVLAGPNVPHDLAQPDINQGGSMWHRASITLDETFKNRIPLKQRARSAARKKSAKKRTIPNDGRGDFTHGETEDYAGFPENTVDCQPNPAATEHHQDAQVAFLYSNDLPLKVTVTAPPADVAEFGGVGKNGLRNFPGTDFENGFYIKPKQDSRNPLLQQARASFLFEFRNGQRPTLDCDVDITHAPASGGGGGDNTTAPPGSGGAGDGSGDAGGDGGGGDSGPATLVCPDPPDLRHSRYAADDRIGNGALSPCSDDILEIALELESGEITDAQHHSHRVPDGTCRIEDGTHAFRRTLRVDIAVVPNGRAVCEGKPEGSEPARIIDMSVETQNPCSRYLLTVLGRRGGRKDYVVQAGEGEVQSGTC